MKKFYYSPLLAIAVWLTGCQQIIDIDLPDLPAELVVNCTFMPDSAWQARVSASQGIQVGTTPPAVTDASVYVLENGLVIDTLRYAYEDLYIGNPAVKPQTGHTYTLQVAAPGYTAVTGTDYVPAPAQAHDVAWRDSVTIDQFEYHLGEFSFQIDDPAGVGNYYYLSILAVDTLFDGTDTVIYSFSIIPQIQDPVLEYDNYSGAIRFDDATFDGQTRTVKLLIRNDDHDYASFLAFALSSTSEHYYRYGQTMSDYLETSFNPFAEPVRIHSNMTPGMGIFAGYTTVLGLVP